MADDLVYRNEVLGALLEAGQKSRRYKLGDIWELNFDEIRDAIATVQSAQSERKEGDLIDAIKCIAYEVISEAIGTPYDYIDTSRDDLLTLGEIYGIVKVTNTICEKVEGE